jgi:hypothetical protein
VHTRLSAVLESYLAEIAKHEESLAAMRAAAEQSKPEEPAAAN